MLHHGLRAVQKPRYTYNDRYSSTTNLTTYTFSSSNIGSPTGVRLVVVAVNAATPDTARSLSSATIGGVTASLYTNNSVGFPAPFIAALVPTGTTADIVLTFSSTMSNCSVAVYSLYNLTSTTPSSTFNGGTWSSNANTGTLAVNSGGIVLASVSASTNGSITWTNVTEDFDTVIETRTYSGGAKVVSATDAAYSITATSSVTTTSGRLSAIHWR